MGYDNFDDWMNDRRYSTTTKKPKPKVRKKRSRPSVEVDKHRAKKNRFKEVKVRNLKG